MCRFVAVVVLNGFSCILASEFPEDDPNPNMGEISVAHSDPGCTEIDWAIYCVLVFFNISTETCGEKHRDTTD